MMTHACLNVMDCYIRDRLVSLLVELPMRYTAFTPLGMDYATHSPGDVHVLDRVFEYQVIARSCNVLRECPLVG